MSRMHDQISDYWKTVNNQDLVAEIEKCKNTFSAEILEDSLNPKSGGRVTTMLCTYPRSIHSELMTHRRFSRNSASSRAIPFKKMLERVRNNPYIPLLPVKDKSGMQGTELFSPEDVTGFYSSIFCQKSSTLEFAEDLAKEHNPHKQIINRYVEPFMWITVVVTSSYWENFFKQRVHQAAEPHMQFIAEKMYDAFKASQPKELEEGEYHLPFVGEEEKEEIEKYATSHEEYTFQSKKFPGQVFTVSSNLLLPSVSVARCARVSYEKHNVFKSLEDDLDLHEFLARNNHWSPFEHVAVCGTTHKNGNLAPGFCQYRKMFSTEDGDSVE